MLVADSVEATGAFNGLTHVSDGRSATSLIQAEQPRAVLLDLRMPGMSGWEVLDELREADLLNRIFVAILSNSNSATDRKEAAARGAHAYFVKPVSAEGYDEIVETLAQAIEG